MCCYMFQAVQTLTALSIYLNCHVCGLNARIKYVHCNQTRIHKFKKTMQQYTLTVQQGSCTLNSSPYYFFFLLLLFFFSLFLSLFCFFGTGLSKKQNWCKFKSHSFSDLSSKIQKLGHNNKLYFPQCSLICQAHTQK